MNQGKQIIKKKLLDYFKIFKSQVDNRRTFTYINYSLLRLFQGTFGVANNIKIESPDKISNQQKN